MHVLLALCCVVAQVPAPPPLPPPGPAAVPPAASISVVYQAVGSPVVVEGTRSAEGRAHARVRVKNVSARTVTTVTVVITLGDRDIAARMPLRRLSEAITIALRPGAAQEVALRGLTSAQATALMPASGGVAELGVIEATFADGSHWVSMQPVGWLDRPHPRRPVECVDAQGRVQAVGDLVADGGTTTECRADGVTVRR